MEKNIKYLNSRVKFILIDNYGEKYISVRYKVSYKSFFGKTKYIWKEVFLMNIYSNEKIIDQYYSMSDQLRAQRRYLYFNLK